MSFDEDQKRRGRVRRQKVDDIKGRILSEMEAEIEICWIVGDWWQKGINPARIQDKEKGVWHG